MAARQEIAKQVVFQKLVASEDLLPTPNLSNWATVTDDKTAKRLAYE